MSTARDGYTTLSPATGREHANFPFISDAEIKAVLERADRGFAYLSKTSIDERSAILNKLADAIDAHQENLAAVVTLEMGKPITQARGEVAKCAAMCRYHAEHAERFLKSETIATDAVIYEIHQEPLGPVLFISTWNNPFLQATLAAAPQLVAGNPVVVKPAPNAPQCVLKFAELVKSLNLPEEVYLPALTSIEQTEGLLLDPALKGVTFIGSTKAGRRVGSLAGQSFKASVIDAGGSDPFVVLADADVPAAAKAAVEGRFGNTGQSCVAAKRIIVHKDIYDEFVEAFVAETKQLVVGDPEDESVTIGPLARHVFRDEIKKYLDESVAAGAKVVHGGGIPDNDGAFLDPTVVVDVTLEMPLATEEIFGPVAVIFKAGGNEDAVRLANSTPFGLGASVWAADPRAVADQLETGNVALNSKIATNFPVPFGGTKASGCGVYFGVEGVRTFTNSKVLSYPNTGKKNEV